jgi:flavin-dependent dehydrogenase
VAGGGPAGAAAAIVLAAGGASVVVIERSDFDGARIGETLPPDVRPRLERLGVWDQFVDAGHLPSPGIVAAWGQPEPYANDFVLNPYGCGWRIDRNRFDAMLAAAAGQAGATVVTATGVVGCRRAGAGGWELSLAGDAGVVAAGAVVDATGRSSPVGRWLGARTEVHDRLVALVGFAAGPSTEDRRALIEATPEGWWYSGLLPDGRLVLAFHTDAGPDVAHRWDRFLAAAPLTAARAAGRPAAVPGAVRVVAAPSRRAEPAAGDGWLAAGDAAAAHDPICGLGILWAVDSGIAAAEAVLAGSAAAVDGYARDQAARFDRYLDTRTRWYRMEDRWPAAPFWARRHR